MSLTGKYLETFLRRIRRGPDCWTWDGAHISTGYPETWDGVRPLLAHRVAHELWVGPIPAGYEVDHLCRNRACVNPDHLEAVPGKVNNMRSMSQAAVNARKTHCKRGHEFTPENTRITPRGTRTCRACNRADCAERYVANPKVIKTHCPRGHEYTEYVSKSGKPFRACKECNRVRAAKRRES